MNLIRNCDWVPQWQVDYRQGLTYLMMANCAGGRLALQAAPLRQFTGYCAGDWPSVQSLMAVIQSVTTYLLVIEAYGSLGKSPAVPGHSSISWAGGHCQAAL
jgi:hypothetical protein